MSWDQMSRGEILEVKCLKAKNSLKPKSLEAKCLEAKSLEAKCLEAKCLEAKYLEVKNLVSQPCMDQDDSTRVVKRRFNHTDNASGHPTVYGPR